MKNIKQHILNFIKLESSSGLVLFFAALCAVFFANIHYSEKYFSILEYKFINLSLAHWISDGLMAIFFFVVGLEIKREIIVGELSTKEKASLPIVAAFGGMLVPALIYLVFNNSKPQINGWAIPMATDIAFAIGLLSLFGKKVPLNLKIFLLALAVVDDLGAVLVIALFYTQKITYFPLIAAFALMCIIWIFQKNKISHYFFYLALGILIWLGFLLSGVHATIAGVLLGLLTPYKFSKKKKTAVETYSPVDQLIHWLHPVVGYLIMPIFALANAGISFSGVSMEYVINNSVAIGIILGLALGKPAGILLFCYVANKLGWARLPAGLGFKDITAVACVAGIGFTMSIFISNLAFIDQENQSAAKLGVVFASMLSAWLGAILLFVNFKLSKKHSY